MMNDLGLGTLLGNASPVSPRWDYLREQGSENDGDAPRRGSAPNVEPPPGSPEYQSAALQAYGYADGAAPPSEPTRQMASLTIPIDSGLGAAPAGQTLKSVGARLIPAASGLAAGGAVLLTPRNTPATTYDLGDGLRAQSAPGQRSISIERRVDDGLLGTGWGAKWEQLPVEAELGPRTDGTVGLKINPDQLKAAVGAETANRVLNAPGGKDNPLLPPPISNSSKIEVRIGASINGGEKTEIRKATPEEVQKLCPSYPEYVRMGTKIADDLKAAGWENGAKYGTRAHTILADQIEMQNNTESELQARVILEREPEFALREGMPKSYSKGYYKLDILELHRDYATVCVFDLKTGGATISEARIYELMRNASIYAKSRQFGYPNVYFIPVHVH